jgi:hypothetical protein
MRRLSLRLLFLLLLLLQQHQGTNAACTTSVQTDDVFGIGLNKFTVTGVPAFGRAVANLGTMNGQRVAAVGSVSALSVTIVLVHPTTFALVSVLATIPAVTIPGSTGGFGEDLQLLSRPLAGATGTVQLSIGTVEGVCVCMCCGDIYHVPRMVLSLSVVRYRSCTLYAVQHRVFLRDRVCHRERHSHDDAIGVFRRWNRLPVDQYHRCEPAANVLSGRPCVLV